MQHDDRQRTRSGQRAVNGAISLHVPTSVIKAKIALYSTRGKPARRAQVINFSDHDIVRIHGAEYRGIVQYYLLAGDVRRLHRLRRVQVSVKETRSRAWIYLPDQRIRNDLGRLGRYELVERLGEGRSGATYLGADSEQPQHSPRDALQRGDRQGAPPSGSFPYAPYAEPVPQPTSERPLPFDHHGQAAYTATRHTSKN